jgi:hypothetical protein
MAINSQRFNPNAQIKTLGPNKAGATTGAASTSEALVTVMPCPKLIDLGELVDFKSTFALSAFNKFSVSLDGSDEMMTTPHAATLDFDWDDPFSTSCWFKSPFQASWQGIGGKMDPGNDYRGYFMIMYQGQVGILLCSNWGGGSGNAAFPLTTTSTFDDDSWHHVACVVDGSGTSAGVDIYVDGVSQSTSNYYLSNINGNTMTNTEPFEIGNSWGLASYYLDGNVDEFSVWDKELSSGEVADIWNEGSPNNLLIHSAVANLVSWWRMGDGDNGAGTDDSTDSSDASARIYDMSTNSHDLTPVNMEAGDIVGTVP